jgi:hypothetical protein
MELPNGKARPPSVLRRRYQCSPSPRRGHCGWLWMSNFAKAEADRGAGETVLIQDRNRWVDAAYQWAGTRQPQWVEGVPVGSYKYNTRTGERGRLLLVACCLLDNIAKTVRRCAAGFCHLCNACILTHSPCRLRCSGRYPKSSRWHTDGPSQSGSTGLTRARATPES